MATIVLSGHQLKKVLKLLTLSPKLINDFKKVISSHQLQLKDQSNSLSVTLSIKNVNVSLMKMDPCDDLDNIIKWYENKVLNKEFLKQYEMFYFPLNPGYNSIPILILSIRKKIKSDIISGTVLMQNTFLILNLNLTKDMHVLQPDNAHPLHQKILLLSHSC